MEEKRRNAREAGLVFGRLPPGPLNAITDVKDVRVGHATLSRGNVQTGVTVVLPHEADAERALWFYGCHIFNGHGEATGIQVLEDFGMMSAPVFLTNATAVGRVYNGGITFGYGRDKGLPTDGGWPPIIMSIDDRYLNDLRERAVTEQHALEAVEKATGGVVDSGSVGAGTGAVAFGFKGGIGTSSRRVDLDASPTHVGMITLANHGRREELVINGVTVGKKWKDATFANHEYCGVVGVVATDAPMSPRQLNHLAQRAVAGWQCIGGLLDSSTTAMVVAFSTGLRLESAEEAREHRLEFVPENRISAFYYAAAEAAEESVINALFRATTVTGRDGRVAQAVPVDTIIKMMKTNKR
jgi:D-aminopeptidase